MKQKIIKFFAVCFVLGLTVQAAGATVQQRLDADLKNGVPIVIHVSVALADNKNQWIVPVPDNLGNGQDERTNLYWGALYGVKTYMVKTAGWKKCLSVKPEDKRIRERLVLKKLFPRNGIQVPVYLVADAWDGKYIKETISQFFRYNAGADGFQIMADEKTLQSGGEAHLIVYMGHNALMDYAGLTSKFFPDVQADKGNPDNDAIVLACKSQPYFEKRIEDVGAFPLVLTTGLMAPEAYTLHAAIEKWVAGADRDQIRQAAAKAYNTYQKTGIRAAQRLFDVK